MIHRVAHGFVVLALAACGGRSSGSEVLGPGLGETHATQPRTRSPISDEPVPAPRELTALAAAVDAIGEHGRLDHSLVAQALYRLADAIGLVGADHAALHRRVLVTTTDRLVDSPPHATHHADLVRRALDEALRAFATGRPRTPARAAYTAAVVRFGELVREIDPAELLLPQHADVVEALHGALAVLEVATGVSGEPSSHISRASGAEASPR